MTKDTLDVVNDFEAWAKVSAQLHGLGDAHCELVLTELGILELWNNADAAWSRALSADMNDMKLDRAKRYGVIFARELELRRVAGGRGSVPDFRHTAVFGTPDASRDGPARQVGGTPFGDPDERAPTKKMHSREVREALQEKIEQLIKKD
jgi:hypothetical protein